MLAKKVVTFHRDSLIGFIFLPLDSLCMLLTSKFESNKIILTYLRFSQSGINYGK